MEHVTPALICGCQRYVEAGWKVNCPSCGRREFLNDGTLRPVAELAPGDQVLIYGDVEATVEAVDDATKAGDRRPWTALAYVLANGLRGGWVTPAATPVPVLSAELSHPAGILDLAS
jgi:hypothetical protein